MNKNNRMSEFSLILITQDNHNLLVVYEGWSSTDSTRNGIPTGMT